MAYFYRIACFTFLTLLLHYTATGQQRRILVTGSYDSASFEQFAADIESKTECHFFFNPAALDSIKVTLNASAQPLTEILDELFLGKDVHYAIDNKAQIFITERRDITTELPLDFFGEAAAVASRPATIDFDYSAYEKREKEKKLEESKLYVIGKKTTNLQGTATMAGHVRDITNGEPVIGAAVYVENPTIGVATDQFGYYSITLAKGRHELHVKSVGMKSTIRQIMLYGDGSLGIELDEDVTPLKEVVVQSERDVRVTGLQMGMEKLDIKTMKNMPLALGETDIMKVVLTLPGVQTVGEGTVGLNVRGGATNQNLILFNDAVIYNPSHLFGFFSTFNPDVLKNVDLYKSGITADYGGRLSSVLDVSSREGNLKKFSASGGISPITGRLTLEGPIVKDRTSFLLGFRSTYSNWIMRQLDSDQLQESTASFYDMNLNVSHKINDNNHLYLSGYLSQDHFKLGEDTTYSYSDKNASVKWKHIFNTKLYAVLTGGFSRYNYSVTSDANPVNAFEMDFAVQQLSGKLDFSYFLNPKHTITAGLSTTRYSLEPGDLQPKGSESLVVPDVIQNEQGQESAVYIGDNFEISPKLSLYAGIRYSYYQYLGPHDVYQYAPGISKEESTIQDTLHYSSGNTIASYHGPEPRFSIRYILSNNASVKFSYNRMRQYIQMLSNTTAITPTDIWKLSDSYIQPQIGDQISIGFYKNLRGRNSVEFSVEGYYKTMENSVDFKNGAVLLLNPHIETDVVNAEGRAYGAEFMIKKGAGKLNGWITYTYSRSLLKANGATPNETVNQGAFYPSSYDKPHAVNFIGNYKFSRRVNFSLNVVYSTGRPITLPLAKYELTPVGSSVTRTNLHGFL
jgi:hypothetical protein